MGEERGGDYKFTYVHICVLCFGKKWGKEERRERERERESQCLSCEEEEEDTHLCFAAAMVKIKVHELRSNSKPELQNQLKELKAELALLKVAKVTGGAPNKLSKIKVFKLSIAQVLTILFNLVVLHQWILEN